MGSLTTGLAIQYIRRTVGLTGASLRTLRWLAVITPVATLVAIDNVRHFVFPAAFHDWAGYFVLWGLTLIGALGFSGVVFGVIERMHKEILDRNRELLTLYTAAQHQAEQLRALREAGMALTAELSLETVLQKVVDLSRELVGTRYGALAVYNEERKIERLITSGLALEVMARIADFPSGKGIMSILPETRTPLRLADIRKHPLSVGFPPNHPEMKTFLGVPIISKGEIIGNIKLTNKKGGGEFTQEDEDKVVMLAAQAAIAIENAKLYEQEHVLAVLEDRERIAQELHDGIIQDIYAIGLSVEQCMEQVGAGHRTVADRLVRAVDGLNDIIKDVRNYIFALRPTDLQDHDLAMGLENMAREFRINSLVDTELIVKGDVDGALGRDQVGHVLQIAREALTNVLKHAKATSVTIEISRLEDRVEMSIEDNGIGFDLLKASNSGQGLRNIRERSKSLGGDCTIGRGPENGARLAVRIPLPD